MRARGDWASWLHMLLGVTFALMLVAVYAQARRAPKQRAAAEANRPAEQVSEGYASSDTCRACHPGAYDSWAHSYHRTMTTAATPATVFGAFDGRTLSEGPVRFSVRQEGDRFLVQQRTPPRPGQAGQAVDKEGAPVGPETPIALVTGSHHMQIYWYETGQGRALGQLPFAYLEADDRWVPRSTLFLRPPSRGFSPETGRWNNTCLHCHTTRAQPLASEKGYDTRVSEMGVACEACHGPGEAHVARFQSPLSRYRSHLGGEQETDIVNPAKLDHVRASQICSQCHAMWQFDEEGAKAFNTTGYPYRPGEDAEQSMWLFAPSRKETDTRVRNVVENHHGYTVGQFWPDGQARVSGREYNGMQDSGCFQRGEMSCMSCHSMHKPAEDTREDAVWADDQLHAGLDGDEGCLQCHGEYRDNPTAHTGHGAESAGSRCYNCHMPYTSYGLLKAIRSHKITSPSVDETSETGRLNACNACHLDKSLGWTAKALRERFDVETKSELTVADATLSMAAVHALKGDAAQRAVIAWALGWHAARDASRASGAGDAWMRPLLGHLMDDPYAAVRYIAGRAVGRHGYHFTPPFDHVEAPGARLKMAKRVAMRTFAETRLAPPPSIPLRADGTLTPEGEALLKARDQTPINLLE